MDLKGNARSRILKMLDGTVDINVTDFKSRDAHPILAKERPRARTRERKTRVVLLPQP
jgi:hypothetical protein